jgi:hypothetical protein
MNALCAIGFHEISGGAGVSGINPENRCFEADTAV